MMCVTSRDSSTDIRLAFDGTDHTKCVQCTAVWLADAAKRSGPSHRYVMLSPTKSGYVRSGKISEWARRPLGFTGRVRLSMIFSVPC